MQRIIAMILILCTILSLVGCDSIDMEHLEEEQEILSHNLKKGLNKLMDIIFLKVIQLWGWLTLSNLEPHIKSKSI